MTVARARKPKKPETHRPPQSQKERWDIIRTANYTTLAIVIRTLWTVYGWRDKRIAYFLEAYLSLLAESSKFGVWKIIHETEEMTGVDVQKLVNEIYNDKP